MITYYYKNLRATKVSQLEEYKPGTWVHVEAPTPEEVSAFTKQFKLEPGLLEDALDPDEMPRLQKEGSLTYLFIRFAYTGSNGELTTAPLLFIIGANLFMTISPNPLPRLQKFVAGGIDFATTQRTRLLLMVLDQVFERYEQLINRVGRQINATRSRLKGHQINNQDFVDFVVIEDELNEFLSALEPTTVILRRLLAGKHVQLFEEDQDLVEDLLLNNEQSIEACRTHVKSITSIREAYSTIASNNLNHTMKLLTAATVIIALPNVIFGMYGMNVDIPFQHEPWMYPVVVLASLLLCVTVYTIGRKKHIF
ncbi:MAG TPA: magnesium transporter CorA family protein [Candidatus Saccharimonas sp.]|nr:magnesium transporter CorA family protein [Candidatus Saccharimonas sp.]